jgi:hypothetical protein
VIDGLRIADYLVSESYGPTRAELGKVLDNSSAKWQVLRDSMPGLVARVPEGVQNAVEAVMKEGTAGQLLGRPGPRCTRSKPTTAVRTPQSSMASRLRRRCARRCQEHRDAR